LLTRRQRQMCIRDRRMGDSLSHAFELLELLRIDGY
jgi:hypothetical protein